MTAPWVVEHLDIIEHIASGNLPSRIDSPLEQLEEAFGYGVVVAVTTTTHTAHQLIGFQKALPVGAAELTSLDALLRSSGDFEPD